MLAWIGRGLRQGRATTRYPRHGERAPDGFEGRVTVVRASGAGAGAGQGAERVRAACAAGEIVVVDDAGAPLARRARWLGRSLHVRHIDCGSDGSEEWEIQALWNPHYDIQRLGIFLTDSPRHADVLLATGLVTAPMRAPLERTWEVMPAPKLVIAVGDDACGVGLHGGGVDGVLRVGVYVPGAPPAPVAIMRGLMLAAGIAAPDGTAATTGTAAMEVRRAA